MKKLQAVTLVAALAPFFALADSQSGTTKAEASLDFKVTVPRVLMLQVGSASAIHLLTFDVPADKVGKGTAVAPTGGDVNNSAVTVRVMANGGDVTLNNRVIGAMKNTSVGAATTTPIEWNEISVVAGTLPVGNDSSYTNAAIPHPAFNASSNGLGTPVTLAATAGVVRIEGSWTFAYANTKTHAAGVYGESAGNGRVVYTATTP